MPAHGYTHSCVQISWFKQTLLRYSPEQQADFVEFLTLKAYNELS